MAEAHPLAPPPLLLPALLLAGAGSAAGGPRGRKEGGRGAPPFLFSFSLSLLPLYSCFHGDGDLSVVAAAGRSRPDLPCGRPDLLPQPPDLAPKVLGMLGLAVCGDFLRRWRGPCPAACPASGGGCASAAAPMGRPVPRPSGWNCPPALACRRALGPGSVGL
jgi:hypothetical protein